MLEHPLLWAGGAAAVSMILAAWSYIRGLYQHLLSRLVVTAEFNDGAAMAVLVYCQDKMRHSPYGKRSYTGWNEYVRPLRRRQVIALEVLGSGGKLYWIGWLPIWLSRSDDKWAENLNTMSRPVRATFLRGTLDIDQFVIAAVLHFNNVIVNPTSGCRYGIEYVTGSDGKPAQYNSHGSSGDMGRPTAVAGFNDGLQNRLLHWKREDIGMALPAGGAALDRLSLSKPAEALVERIRHWQTMGDWLRDRGIPWKMGVLLYGEPGCGKTALVRAIAQDLDLPVFVFDLATLYNDELKRAWSDMLTRTPCVALIEDIDGVFHGRERVNKDAHLTFDCVLNCIDGLAQADGLLLMVTTNNPSQIDDTLAGGAGQELTTRPGRIDQVVRMGPLDDAGRLKLALRILKGWSASVQLQVVMDGDGDTGAQFQKRCIDRASELLWQPAPQYPATLPISQAVGVPDERPDLCNPSEGDNAARTIATTPATCW